MSVSESDEIHMDGTADPFESYVYRVLQPKVNHHVEVAHFRTASDNDSNLNYWGNDSSPSNQQLGPFFGFFNNLFSDQISNSGSGSGSGSGSSSCSGCAARSSAYLTGEYHIYTFSKEISLYKAKS